MKRFGTLCLTLGTASIFICETAQAQLFNRLDRRVERNLRQLDRQADRMEYYTERAWNDIEPWVTQNGIAPVRRAANAVRNATERVDANFGFVDGTRDDQWFYDYYTYTPTYYYDRADDRYAAAVRYFDSDGDGVFDYQTSYRDQDSDGVFDEFDRINFSGSVAVSESSTTQSQQRSNPSTTSHVYDGRRHQVDGKIAMTKLAKVNGTEHLIAGLKDGEDDVLAVDLGPAKRIDGHDIKVGNQLTATGTFEQIGEKEVLIAESFSVGGQEIPVDRSGSQSYEGRVVEVKRTPVGSDDHYIAIVEVDGERQLMDLGPVTTYKVEPQASTRVVVHGIPVRARGHRILLANRVQMDGEVFTINRVNIGL